MHILVVNDDGPPSPKSPYVRHLVDGLQAAGHTVSVVLPDGQRSWIGKAHLINETVQCVPLQSAGQEGWVLVNSTPAACVHVGLHHCFPDRGPVDLVISGPNFGLNASALFSLLSGTLGAAFEAALCRKRAIALSYAQSGDHNVDAVVATVQHSIKIAEALMKQWPKDDEGLLFSVNMAVSENIAWQDIVWTETAQSFWGPGGAFVKTEGSSPATTSSEPTAGPLLLKWAPDLGHGSQGSSDLHFKEDLAVLEQGKVSITPFRANFAAAAPALHGTRFVI